MLDKILLTGGSGLLGRELQKYLPCEAPSHKDLDITKPETITKYNPDIVVHCAGYTDVARAEEEKRECFGINVTGTYNMANLFRGQYFVYISSEYAVRPVNYYSYTKQWGEQIVRTYCPNHLIIRTLFKKNPYPYEYAFFDQYSGGDYVDIIAPIIAKCILGNEKGTIFVGTGRKSMFQLARRTVPDIKAISVHDIKNVRLPEDTYYG